ncbi:penicillin-binding protein 1C [Polymorphum gilvum]|uniref:penicillin-binding protein 1C n=1 Tax=Polymorphum gilvum TaxID=991904 RepID=UPI003BB7B46E
MTGLRIVLVAVAGLAVAAAGFVALDVARAPDLPGLAEISVSRVVLDRNDRLLRAFVTADERWRLPVSLRTVDPLLIDMLIAYEDRRFRDHLGVDPLALIRAGFQALANGRTVSGGSTLTMQVVRLLRETPTRTLTGKYRQMVDALALERRLAKDDILALYLLRAPYGGNLEGIRAASLVWLGKEPWRLTPAEAALLVALPQAPESRRPDRFIPAARRARDRVLERAAAAGVIDRDTAEAAKREAIPTLRRPMPMLAAHLAREVVVAAPERIEHRLTLDRDLQAALEDLLSRKVAALGPRLSGALVVADHASGDILALAGSPGLLDDDRLGHIDMTRAVRSPGSTLKPLIYGLAFEQGVAHPESYIEDRPIRIAGYDPTNFDRAFQGTVTAREALQLSLNIPAVRLLDAVGPAQLTSRLRRAGARPVLPAGLTPGLAVGLGGVGLTLRELTGLYASLGHGGAARPLRYDRDESLPVPGLAAPVLDRAAAWQVSDILLGAPRPDTAADGGIAFKTGTAYGYRDAFALGFDGRHVVGVWTGRPDGSPVPGMTGLSAAAPILFEAFHRLGAQRVALPAPPPGVLLAATANLPPPLRHARVRSVEGATPTRGDVRIAHPPDGAEVDLGLVGGATAQKSAALVAKVRGGSGPYTWFANGTPVASGPFLTRFVWQPDGPGHATIMVVDGRGRTDRIDVILR